MGKRALIVCTKLEAASHITLSCHHGSLTGKVALMIEGELRHDLSDLPHLPVHLPVDALIFPSDVVHLGEHGLPDGIEPDLEMADLFIHPLNHSTHSFNILADLLRHLCDSPLETFGYFRLLLLSLFDSLIDIH